MTRLPEITRRAKERILLCGLLLGDQQTEHEGELAEIAGLVEAAEGEVVGPIFVQRRARPDAATLFGKGKVAEIAEVVTASKPDAVAVDNDLTPAQGRNLEKAWGVRVIDRSELILDIFARRAQTRQARLQVELAQNEYVFPRLRRMWTHLERTEGAIGTRGPGETQLETDRRLLRKRISDLKRELAEIEARKRREVRSRSERFTIGLVGYTNAGKSTLLNRLTGSHELVADMLFATLDTRTRQWRLSDGRVVLLSDTVGFLRRLPHHLVASFHATLEETLNADLLIHVVDAAHPDAAGQMSAVDEVLRTLSPHTRAEILALNKIDQVRDPVDLHYLPTEPWQEVVHLSARSGVGLDRLDEMMMRRLDARSALIDLRLPLADGRTTALAKSLGKCLAEEVIGDTEIHIRLRIEEGALGNFLRQAGPDLKYERLEGPQAAAHTPPLPRSPESPPVPTPAPVSESGTDPGPRTYPGPGSDSGPGTVSGLGTDSD